MANYYISDWHGHHENILRFNPDSRKFNTTDEMNAAIFAGLESLPDNSVVYNLGDVSFGGREKAWTFYEETNAILVKKSIVMRVVKGNHDQHLQPWLEHKSSKKGLLFIFLDNYVELKDGSHRLVLFHYPIEIWNGKHKGVHHLMGHTHKNIPQPADTDHHSSNKNGRRIHVGVDAIGFVPKTIEELLVLSDQGIC